MQQIHEATLGVKLPTPAELEPLALELLEPCSKDEAHKATVIRKFLKAKIGRWQAEAILACYREACLRNKGTCRRYFLDGDCKTVRLRLQ